MCNSNNNSMTLDDIARYLSDECFISENLFFEVSRFINLTYGEVLSKINEIEKNLINIFCMLDSDNTIEKLLKFYNNNYSEYKYLIKELKELKNYEQLMLQVNNEKFEKMFDEYYGNCPSFYFDDDIPLCLPKKTPPSMEDNLIYLLSIINDKLSCHEIIDLAPTEFIVEDETAAIINNTDNFILGSNFNEGEYDED